jgi:RNA-binding protein
MLEISPAQKRELRAQAHHLNPVVSISHKGLQDGLQATVIGEIDRSLKSHALIKVRLYGIERDERASLIDSVCAAVQCALVQHIGNLLVLWRPLPAGETAKSALVGRRSSGARPMTKKQAAAANELDPKKRSPARAPSRPRRRAIG